MNFCQKCGNKNDGNTRFCQKCGNMLQPINMQPQVKQSQQPVYQQMQPGAYQQAQYNVPQQPAKKKDSPLAIIAAAFILITIFPLPAFIAFALLLASIILCLIDLGIHDKKYRHIGCVFLLIISIAMFLYVLSVLQII
ncbi:MAG: zinc-ribbon domain-containing protein [Lachnospiraceae bacterium]